MKYTRENVIEGINRRVDSLVNINDDYKNRLKQRLTKYPREIETNILQWLNGEPITTIDCHGVSMKYVIDTCSLEDDDIIWLIDNFVTYAQNDFQVYADCFGMFQFVGGDG